MIGPGRAPRRGRGIAHVLHPAGWIVLALAVVTPLTAQEAPVPCDFEGSCRSGAEAGVDLYQELALALGAGAEPGLTTSTLGRRLGSPRWAFGARLAVAPITVRDLFSASDVVAVGETLVWRLSLSAEAGLFDGWSPLPTVGGVGAVDLFAAGGWLLLPDDPDGFSGTTATGGLGARIGLLRESFTLPGVSITAMRRWHGGIRYGRVDPEPDDPPGGGLRFDRSAVDHLRVVVGKDLLGLQLFGGWGRNSGSVGTDLRLEGSPPAVGTTTSEVEHDLWFIGAGLDLIFLRLGGELAWASLDDGTDFLFGLGARLLY